MGKPSILYAVFFSAIFAGLCGSSAFAQASRTWVSGVGDDANPCSRTAPCKTFAGAISKTAAGGEINCIDPGGFGGVTITKSITIDCLPVNGGLLVAGTNAIVVNAPASALIVIRGLDIEGFGTGLNGIRFLAGGSLHVDQCVIRNFRAGGTNGNGIQFAPAASAELVVTNSLINNNGTGTTGAGIAVEPSASAVARVSIANVNLENNVAGLKAAPSGAASSIKLAMVDSLAAGNSANGIVATGVAGGAPVELMLNRVSAVNNEGTGVRTEGSAVFLRMANTTVFGNATGKAAGGGSQLVSYGNNQIDGNNLNGGDPPIIPQK